MLQIKNLHFSYAKLDVLKDVNAHFEKGKIYGIVGPNGSGKTTLFNTLTGILTPRKGELAFSERPSFGISFHSAGFDKNLTIAQTLQTVAICKGVPQSEVDEAVSYWKLGRYRNKKLKQLSQGTVQKVSIISSLFQTTNFVLLDEPTNGLDVDSILDLRDYLQAKKAERTLLIASHTLTELERNTDSILFLRYGELSPPVSVKEIIDTHGSLEAKYLSLLNRTR
ncbi:MAG: ABC transporter ATP-binding protein [Leadbetterella sp.]|nr:ABC transporter ATP-binding protein [Leadbetterella sp.]